jgi:DNA-binding MarR family transcriptional regulator
VAWGSGITLPLASLAILKHLRDEGPTTAAALAATEHVSHQAIGQSLAGLKRAGLVRAAPDPTDGRKSVIQITPSGRRLFESAIASRDAWLTHAIGASVPAGERAALERAILLLERLADVDGPTAFARK